MGASSSTTYRCRPHGIGPQSSEPPQRNQPLQHRRVSPRWFGQRHRSRRGRCRSRTRHWMASSSTTSRRARLRAPTTRPTPSAERRADRAPPEADQRPGSRGATHSSCPESSLSRPPEAPPSEDYSQVLSSLLLLQIRILRIGAGGPSDDGWKSDGGAVAQVRQNRRTIPPPLRHCRASGEV